MASKLTILLLFLCSTLSSIAQDFVISGRVLDQDNKGVAYANVVLLNAKDSLAIGGTTTDDNGDFKLEGLTSNKYILKVTFLGFESYETAIDLNENTSVGTVILKEANQALEGVTVVAKRPTVKRMVDRLVFNVENSTLSNSNVLDVLKHTPGVLVHDGKITVKNTLPTVYINDRKVHLSIEEVQQLLEGTSATNVKSVEVITNPPAKYEAEGGAVLNIVTSKNIVAGYNGSVFGNYKQGQEYPKYSFGTSHFFKSKKVNTYLNYNISPRKEFRKDDEFINFINNNQIISCWISSYNREQKKNNQNINTNIDYKLNKNNNLGVSASMLISPRKYTHTEVNSDTKVYNTNNVLDSTFKTNNKRVSELTNLAFTLDYVHKFKEKRGKELSINIHHTNYDFSNFQNVHTQYFLQRDELFRVNKFQTYASQKIKLFTSQIDYELPCDNLSKIEAGLKVSSIKSESILKQYRFENDDKFEDLQNSDLFLYNEVNYAGYIGFYRNWGKWSLKSGIRVEHTSVTGNSMLAGIINEEEYIKFFPSFYLLKQINDKNSFYIKYNKRIYRPRYSELNPFKYFLNDNVYVTGDPNLIPEIDDVYTLGYTINKEYTFELYYRYEKDPTQEISFQDNSNNIIKNTYTNLKNNVTYGLDFTTYSQMLPNWNIYVLSSLYYYKQYFFALESNNELIANDKWSVYSQLINYFTFLKDKSFNAEVSLLYWSPFVDGPSDISSQFAIDVNLKKAFWNNRAYLSIGVLDLFNTKNYTETIKYLNQDKIFKPRLESRLLTIGFSCKFGNYKLRNNKKEFLLNERERLGSN
ncbi:outer membrane beta-barrel protein [Snuella sedimenti]|uniref:TonB-dependent receptor n=1 Tax=Snuella sedimenti TaxID=2798802 RepID=A0A8J7IG23_9FLAO|nr:outer membrane beta-barrel family protein [Snuella sedimenti]MBJ6368657.1 TonB-dependent receptor [Snuella sedimenti]